MGGGGAVEGMLIESPGNHIVSGKRNSSFASRLTCPRFSRRTGLAGGHVSFPLSLVHKSHQVSAHNKSSQIPHVCKLGHILGAGFGKVSITPLTRLAP